MSDVADVEKKAKKEDANAMLETSISSEPFVFSRWIVNYPAVVIVTVFCIVIALIMIATTMPVQFDVQGESFVLQGHSSVQDSNALEAARDFLVSPELAVDVIQSRQSQEIGSPNRKYFPLLLSWVKAC